MRSFEASLAFAIAPALAVALAACSSKTADEQPAAAAKPVPTTLAPPPASEGFQFSMTGITAQPGEEVWRCSVYKVPIDTTANVQWIKYVQTPGLHHVTLSAPGFFRSTLAYGDYDCKSLYGDKAFMKDAIVIYGNAGLGEGEMHLPDGVVAALPPTVDIIHEVHYLNVGTTPVNLYSYLNAYTIPKEKVVDSVYGGSVRDEHLVLPAKSKHAEWSRCVFDTDVQIQFLASHTHGLGRSFSIKPFDGTSVGAELYRNDDLTTPNIVQYTPPMEVKAGNGFEWTCEWNNTTDHEVDYGLSASDEMCNMAVVFTPFNLATRCRVVETSDGVLWQP